MDTKYIVFSRNGEEKAIVFPFCVTHKSIWSAVTRSARSSFSVGNIELVSAGFYRVYPDDPNAADAEVFAHGRSETLDLGSRVEDGKIIAKLLQGDG